MKTTTQTMILEAPSVPTVEEIMDRFYDIVACNGAWAEFSGEIGTRVLLYEVELDDLQPFADYLYENEEWNGCDREAFDEVLLDAFSSNPIDPDLVCSHLLGLVWNTSGFDLDQFVELAEEAGIQPEVIEEFKEDAEEA